MVQYELSLQYYMLLVLLQVPFGRMTRNGTAAGVRFVRIKRNPRVYPCIGRGRLEFDLTPIRVQDTN